MLTTTSYELHGLYDKTIDKLNFRINDNLEKKKKYLKKIEFLDAQNDLLTNRINNEEKIILQFIEHQIIRFETKIQSYNDIIDEYNYLIDTTNKIRLLKTNLNYMILVLLARTKNVTFVRFGLLLSSMKKYNLMIKPNFDCKKTSDKFVYFDKLSNIICTNEKLITNTKKLNKEMTKNLKLLKCLSIITIVLVERHNKQNFIENYDKIRESIRQGINIIDKLN
jgi:hypothetical protein